MSRSYKKYPFWHCGGSTKWAKNQGNRRLRHKKNVGDYGNYKKYYDSWNIRDCSRSESWEQYKVSHKELRLRYPDSYLSIFREEDDYYSWYKTYKKK